MLKFKNPIGVCKLCITNNYLEEQAYEIGKDIQKSTLYQLTAVVISDGTNLEFQEFNRQWNGKDLITKVILEDKHGNSFSINPDQIGLSFAKGEITYKQYKQLQRKDDLKGYSYVMLSIGFLLVTMFSFAKLFM